MKLIIFVSAFFAIALCAHASAPKSAPGTNPGFYRFMVGDIEVNAISDGTFTMDVSQQLTNIDSKEMVADLKKNFLSKDVETSVNALLINTGSKLVLVDTGTGAAMFPTTGHLIEHLKAAGYAPDQVDAVVITHMHVDHIGGLSKNGLATFPNASLYIDKAELDYWLNKENSENTKGMMKKNV